MTRKAGHLVYVAKCFLLTMTDGFVRAEPVRRLAGKPGEGWGQYLPLTFRKEVHKLPGWKPWVGACWLSGNAASRRGADCSLVLPERSPNSSLRPLCLCSPGIKGKVPVFGCVPYPGVADVKFIYHCQNLRSAQELSSTSPDPLDHHWWALGLGQPFLFILRDKYAAAVMLWAGSKIKVFSALLLGLGRNAAVANAGFQCCCFPSTAVSATSTGSGMAAALGQQHVAQLSISSPTPTLQPQHRLGLAVVLGSEDGRLWREEAAWGKGEERWGLVGGKGRSVIRKKSRDGIKRQEESGAEGEAWLETCFKKLKERAVAPSLCQGLGEGRQLFRWVHDHTRTSVKLRMRHEIIES